MWETLQREPDHQAGGGVHQCPRAGTDHSEQGGWADQGAAQILAPGLRPDGQTWSGGLFPQHGETAIPSQGRAWRTYGKGRKSEGENRAEWGCQGQWEEDLYYQENIGDKG